MAQFHAWACKAAHTPIALDVPKKAALAKSALSCLLWLASGYQKKKVGFWLASGWLSGWTSPCLEQSRTYLAETGWTSPLPGGGLVEALPLPQTKQVDGTMPRVGLRSSPGVDRLGRPEKGCTSLTPCKPALPNQPSACLVGLPPAWKNLVLTWQKLVWLDLPAISPWTSRKRLHY